MKNSGAKVARTPDAGAQFEAHGSREAFGVRASSAPLLIHAITQSNFPHSENLHEGIRQIYLKTCDKKPSSFAHIGSDRWWRTLERTSALQHADAWPDIKIRVIREIRGQIRLVSLRLCLLASLR